MSLEALGVSLFQCSENTWYLVLLVWESSGLIVDSGVKHVIRDH